MRITMNRHLTWGLLAIVTLVGCENKSTPPGDGATTGGAIAGRTPRQATHDFLIALGGGKVTPARLTPGFKKLITRPVTDEEKKLGYSDEQASEFLKRFEKLNWIVGEFAEFGPYLVARGRAESSTGKSAFAV